MPLLLVFIVSAFLSVTLSAQTRQYDLIIRNGHIIDGTGSPWYSGDLGIRDGRIAAIGSLLDAQAKNTIDAAGMVVAPGFIDMLGQSDLSILVNPRLRESPPSLLAREAVSPRSTTGSGPRTGWPTIT
jgi:N-acyl-D-amino-acid deacylase